MSLDSTEFKRLKVKSVHWWMRNIHTFLTGVMLMVIGRHLPIQWFAVSANIWSILYDATGIVLMLTPFRLGRSVSFRAVASVFTVITLGGRSISLLSAWWSGGLAFTDVIGLAMLWSIMAGFIVGVMVHWDQLQ